MTELPLPGELNWALKLNTAIEQRDIEVTQDLQNEIDTLAGVVGDEYTPRAEFNPVKATVETGRLSEAELSSTIAAAVSDELDTALDGKADKSYVDAEVAATLQGAKDYADQGIRVVTHGSAPSTARPNGAVVWWIGSVEPTNAQANDVWVNPEDI